MKDLMNFDDVAEMLELDARDEKRNRLFLSAVSEEICLYLDRNILMETSTEYQETVEGEILPREYPVREFVEIVNTRTGDTLSLHPDCTLKDLTRSDAHRLSWYWLDTAYDRQIKISYRHGYELAEVPSLIKDVVIERMHTRLIQAGVTDPKDKKSDVPDPFTKLLPYRRGYLW